MKREEHQNDAKEISADTAVAPVYQTQVVFKNNEKGFCSLEKYVYHLLQQQYSLVL